MPRRPGVKNTPQVIINEIVEEHHKGKSLNESSKEYNKPIKTIKDMVRRENRKKREGKINTVRSRQGRPCKKDNELPPSIQRLDKLSQMRYILASRERYIKQLEMENELMRDFLSLTERK